MKEQVVCLHSGFNSNEWACVWHTTDCIFFFCLKSCLSLHIICNYTSYIIIWCSLSKHTMQYVCVGTWSLSYPGIILEETFACLAYSHQPNMHANTSWIPSCCLLTGCRDICKAVQDNTHARPAASPQRHCDNINTKSYWRMPVVYRLSKKTIIWSL